ncbi:MAG: hypothetical protein JWO53_1257, partial [Chlamydiia bacterium]|nr:hypothetical protein [Chlamydiia bacterium]
SNGNHLTELKMFLNVSDLSQAETAVKMLLKSIVALFKKLNIKNSPTSIEEAIKNGNTIETKLQNFNISVKKMYWDNGVNYSIQVVIQ